MRAWAAAGLLQLGTGFCGLAFTGFDLGPLFGGEGGIDLAVHSYKDLPVVATAAVALILSREDAAPLAYIGGALGTLIGADLTNLDKVSGLGAPVASIGGAGTFDGIFLTGVFAVLLASLLGAVTIDPDVLADDPTVMPRVIAGLRERAGTDRLQIELPDDAHHWRKRTPEWAPPGAGESLVVLRERVLTTVDELAARHVGEQIVLVAHGGVMDVLYRAATRLDLQAPRTWQLPNTAVNRLLWTPEGLSLVGWADTSHLDDKSRDETST